MKHSTFPEVFDFEYYASMNQDAAPLSNSAAYNHFMEKGKREGHAGSPLAYRKEFLSYLTSFGFEAILEIGPGVNPLLSGKNIFYFDVRQGEEFLTYAKQKGVVDFDLLPKIDFYAKDGSLNGIDKQFDLIFSSHCIEHTFDIVTHINQASALLTPGGVYCLIVPDKRYTFDYFKNLTTISDVLYRHSLNTPFHSLKTYLDAVYDTHNDKVRHWNNDHGNIIVTKEDIQRQFALFAEEEGRNPGLHSWIFTEESFHQLFSWLYALGVTQLAPHRVFNVVRGANEFCVVLKK